MTTTGEESVWVQALPRFCRYFLDVVLCVCQTTITTNMSDRQQLITWFYPLLLLLCIVVVVLLVNILIANKRNKNLLFNYLLIYYQ